MIHNVGGECCFCRKEPGKFIQIMLPPSSLESVQRRGRPSGGRDNKLMTIHFYLETTIFHHVV